MLKEACVEDFSLVAPMIDAGAGRIELNSNLAAGGTTPSFGLIKKTVAYAHEHQVPVVVMIRPRGGNFIYNADEIAIMINDMEVAGSLGADAVTFGCLNSDKQLDKQQMSQLVSLAKALNLEVVMHMAFDQIPLKDQHSALEWLADRDVKRILTHGGNLKQPIYDTLAHLKRLIEWAGSDITILPGGGITAANCAAVAQKLGVSQLHGTKIVLTK